MIKITRNPDFGHNRGFKISFPPEKSKEIMATIYMAIEQMEFEGYTVVDFHADRSLRDTNNVLLNIVFEDRRQFL